ncbi:HAD-IC family P-type ATPase [Micrococcus endophyticus]|uniref:HAD-IC family P-type ATPase n=1 Tax=Micrococcus endophyticus TaxID=455343 RepID=UPI002003E0AA|nr:HAD-IC family P-type ATPase [Micrococcus endophyticus]MCK6091583.1 HAD-IC family P-type ATPase [Micrococcus endophyticus]
MTPPEPAPAPAPSAAGGALAGLTAAEVAEREAAGLTNRQSKDTSRSLAEILRVHVLTLFNLAIALCAVVVISLGRWLDLLFSLAAIANVVIGVVQEYSAKRKLDRIALLHQDDVVVIRDGARVPLPMAQIVRDDVVVLRRGDQVPVDGEVLVSDGLDMDEALLTGENDPVPKTPGDAVLSGSAVVAGAGLVRATAVGPASHAARLSAEARRFSAIRSELRGALEKVARWLTIGLVPIIAVIVHGQMTAVGGWAHALAQPREAALEPALIASVAAVTSMIPQGLALMTTIAFAVSALKLAQQEVLIQEQPAVEVLARVDTVCLDKTGTLTEGGVRFHELLAPASASPSTSTSTSTDDDDGAPADVDAAARAVLAWFGADPDANPTAAALREPFADAPPHAPADRVAFSSARRWSAVAFGPEAGAAAGTWLLGAPEALLGDPDAQPGEAGTGRDDVAAVRAQADALSDEGLRVLLLARTDAPLAGNALPAGRVPAAVVTFRENVRPDAAQTLDYFHAQGVRTVVISGDSPRTVAAVAREVGMDVAGHARDGRTLPEDPDALADVMAEHDVFGRVSPDQKKAMVEALQSRGHVVAMTGDGVNDALALKTADLGIAMGNAAPATKAVSRMVLLDGRFDRLPAVLGEGRQVIANMERLAHIYLTKTTYALLFGVVFSLLAWQFPLLPRQASTVDFIMIGLPTFFLALLPNPRRYVPGFLGRALRFAIPSGVVILLSMVALQVYVRLAADHVDLAQQQTAFMITLTLVGLWVLSVMSRPLTRRVVVLILGMYAVLAAVVLVPASRWYHQMEVPPADVLVAALVIAAVGCALIELIHQVHRRHVARVLAAAGA